MKLGVIVECPRGGVDDKVYSYVLQKLCPGLKYEMQSAGKDKSEMIENCGKVVRLLLAQGCSEVFIIWDLMPRWGGKPRRKEDEDAIHRSLVAAEVNPEKVKLVCIEPELESWLLADGEALTSYKQQKCHPHPVDRFTGKKLAPNSKASKPEVIKYLGWKYNDVTEALRITQHVTSWDRIARKHQSFGRLKGYVAGVCNGGTQ